MIEINFLNLKKINRADLCIIPCFENEPIVNCLYSFPQKCQERITQQFAKERFIPRKGEILKISLFDSSPYSEIWVAGLDRSGKEPTFSLRESGGKLMEEILRSKHEKISIIDCLGVFEIILGMLLRSCFFSYKTEKIELSRQLSILTSKNLSNIKKSFETYLHLYEGIKLARQLTFEPANILFPEAFAKRCQNLEKYGIQVQILDEIELSKLGLNALLSVGKGSDNPPRLLILEWKGGDKETKPIALIGKGVCYDSGGINLKRNYLVEMKWDKAGGAAVAGTMLTLALQKAPISVVGIIGLAENLINGSCTRPGDVIKTFSGKTVEIVDTDNEGRLVLADCLTYAQKYFSPRTIVDLGTLTPETFAALGNEYAGLYSNHKELGDSLIDAGNESGEKLWPLPMGPSFAKQILSEIADLKNSGIPFFGEGGAAAEFLKAFVETSIPWAHLDIAGVAWQQEDRPLGPKGVTGFGVGLLVEWLIRNYAKKR